LGLQARALKDRNTSAQGNALGFKEIFFVALKGRPEWVKLFQ
jgi:hypothetical protein